MKTPVSLVENIDCMDFMKRYPDNAAYQRAKYQEKKNDPEFKRKKAEAARKSRQKHKEKRYARAKAYRDENRDAYNKYRNDYRTNNPRGIFDVIKQSAKKRNLPFDLDRNEFVDWYNNQERVCIYCLRKEEDILKDVDVIQSIAKRLSIDRLQNTQGYSIHNIGLCCRRCNTIKGNFFSFEEMKQIGLIISKKFPL